MYEFDVKLFVCTKHSLAALLVVLAIILKFILCIFQWKKEEVEQ